MGVDGGGLRGDLDAGAQVGAHRDATGRRIPWMRLGGGLRLGLWLSGTGLGGGVGVGVVAVGDGAGARVPPVSARADAAPVPWATGAMRAAERFRPSLS